MFKFRIQKLSLEGFRGFEKAELTFPHSNTMLLIGNNGNGKTAILDSIALLLSDFVKRLTDDHHKLYPAIQATDINKIVKKIVIKGDFEVNDNHFAISLTNNAITKKSQKDFYKQLVLQLGAPPILVYYKAIRFFKPMKDFNKLIAPTITEYAPFSCYENAFSTQDITFEDFQTWFRLEEDEENNKMRRFQNFTLKNHKLEIIRKCIKLFFNDLEDNKNLFDDLHVERFGVSAKMIIKKENTHFELNQLSEGERMLLLFVGDIARRMAIAKDIGETNSLKNNELDCTGIVLIDEIDMHLHPKWQQKVMSVLNKTFPNIQFIVASHSPQVLSQVRRESVRILENGHILMPSSNPIGRDANSILEEIQQISKRPKAIEVLIDDYFTAIHRNDTAKIVVLKNNLLNNLDSEDPVFAKADAILTRKKLLMP